MFWIVTANRNPSQICEVAQIVKSTKSCKSLANSIGLHSLVSDKINRTSVTRSVNSSSEETENKWKVRV